MNTLAIPRGMSPDRSPQGRPTLTYTAVKDSDDIGGETPKLVVASVGIAILDQDIAPRRVTEVPKALLQRIDIYLRRRNDAQERHPYRRRRRGCLQTAQRGE